MARLCAILSLLLLGPVAARADERRAALLPVEGEAKLAEQLERQLVAALPPGVKLLGVDETRRLHLAEPSIGRALAAAAEQLKRADGALVRMQRPAAVAAARAAIATLEGAAARFHSRRALAEAHATLAHALLLRPPDEPGAAECFGRALAADPAYAPDASRSPPRVRAMVEAARRRLAPATAPRPAALAPLAGAAGAGLVWISAHRDGAGVQLELVVNGRGGAIERHDHQPTTEARLVAACAARLGAALGPAPAPAAPARPAASAPAAPGPASRFAASPTEIARPAPAEPPAPPPGQRWYKRWWVWTIVGVAVAGTAVGLGVGLTRGNGAGSGGGWDVVFSF